MALSLSSPAPALTTTLATYPRRERGRRSDRKRGIRCYIGGQGNCTASGRFLGEQVPAVAEILPESEIGNAERLLRHKYRADLVIIAPLRLIQSALHLGRPRTGPVILAITPD